MRAVLPIRLPGARGTFLYESSQSLSPARVKGLTEASAATVTGEKQEKRNFEKTLF
jgi:hypothetical protein